MNFLAPSFNILTLFLLYGCTYLIPTDRIITDNRDEMVLKIIFSGCSWLSQWFCSVLLPVQHPRQEHLRHPGRPRCPPAPRHRQTSLQGQERQPQRPVRALQRSGQPDEGAGQEHLQKGPEVLGSTTPDTWYDLLCGSRCFGSGAHHLQCHGEVSELTAAYYGQKVKIGFPYFFVQFKTAKNSGFCLC